MSNPFAFLDAPFEILVYILFCGVMHVIMLLAGLVLATPLCWWGWRRYWAFAKGFAAFCVLLLLTASVMHVIWGWTIRGWVYYSTDYVADFNPFFPINQERIVEGFASKVGRLMPGFGMVHVYASWAAFALATWVGAFMLYLRTRRLWTTPGNAGPDDPPPGELCVHG